MATISDEHDAGGTKAVEPDGKARWTSETIAVVATGATLFATMLAGFLSLFILVSNVSRDSETRLETVRQYYETRFEANIRALSKTVDDRAQDLEARIRAIEVGQASIEGRLTGIQSSAPQDP